MQTCWAYTTLWNCSGINKSLPTEILCFVHFQIANLINNVQNVDLSVCSSPEAIMSIYCRTLCPTNSCRASSTPPKPSLNPSLVGWLPNLCYCFVCVSICFAVVRGLLCVHCMGMLSNFTQLRVDISILAAGAIK